MLTSILTGVDGREGGRDALALASLLARAAGGEVVALHAYAPEPVLSRSYSAEFPARLLDNAQAVLARELAAAGAHARGFVVADGSPARALHRFAEREGVDIIVVGSAHHGPLGRVLAGDVASSTLHGAPCAVAVAPRGYAADAAPMRTIGVAYDGSPESREALGLAGELAEAWDAGVHVVMVVPSLLLENPYADHGIDPLEHDRLRREEAQALVDAAVADLDARATGEVAIGRADEQLGRVTGEADLVVAGSRGYGPLRRLLLGSTSSRLIHEAACPVVVLPRGADEHAGEQAITSAEPLPL